MAAQWVAFMFLLLLSSSQIEAHQRRKISRFLLSTTSGGVDASRATSSCSKDKTLCSRQKTGYGKSQFSNPGCCGDKCVEMDTDSANCGKCGNRCSFGYVCCWGQSKNVNGNDRYNCGQCGNKCASGVECISGMCGYGSAGHGGKPRTSAPKVAFLNG